MTFGAIADDLTGAADLAGTLVRAGVRTALTVGVPVGPAPASADAVVVALKSRTVPAADAVDLSLAALAWLRAAGAARTYFKYCSTFDSTDDGNIGPVADALCDALGAPTTIACPAFPENGRTVYRGYLFVGPVLLSESSLRTHPLTPMTDANLVRVLGRQSRARVGLVPYDTVDRGAAAIGQAIRELADTGVRHAIVDALGDHHLASIARATRDLPLVTGGSALAAHLAAEYREEGLLPDAAPPPPRPDVGGRALVVAGSCSEATRVQVASFGATHRVLHVDPREVLDGADLPRRALASVPELVTSTMAPEEVAAIQSRSGRDRVGEAVERALADVTAALVEHADVRRVIVAGGETAGAVVARLDARVLRVGSEVAPGVPWCVTDGERPLLLVLKSGNFGGPDFFTEALA